MKNAFSLVELSIVLVILGLLTGGILAGQSLIRAAELRSVTTEYQRYITSVHTFRDKYFALPGDMKNATAFWGTATNCPGTNAQPSTDKATCNGDGDGTVGHISTPNTSNEQFRFWQHLANAGLIEGTYTGVTGPDHAYFQAVAGVNVPASKLGDSMWAVTLAFEPGNWAYFQTNYGDVFQFGGAAGSGWGYKNIEGVLDATEVWNIDTKIDDGKPARGIMIATRWTLCTDKTALSQVADLDAEYDFQKTTTCSFLIRNQL